jgi:ribosomal protein S18 acetylase RimI-like enzyme
LGGFVSAHSCRSCDGLFRRRRLRSRFPRRVLGGRELRQRERQVAHEPAQIELVLSFKESRHRGGDALQRAAAKLLHHARKVREEAALRIEPVVQHGREGKRRGGLLDVAAHGIAQRSPAPAALRARRLRVLRHARRAGRPDLSSGLSRHGPLLQTGLRSWMQAKRAGAAPSVSLPTAECLRYTHGMPRLRPYAEKDWPKFLQLDLETAIDALGESSEEEQRKLRERWPKRLAAMGFIAQKFGVADAQLLVLESDDGEYLGHLWLTEGHDASGKQILEVTTMGIRRESRGQGFGRLLMQRAEAEARERGIEDIELSVAGNNRRARDLYRDLGYETVRRTMRKRLRG